MIKFYLVLKYLLKLILINFIIKMNSAYVFTFVSFFHFSYKKS